MLSNTEELMFSSSSRNTPTTALAAGEKVKVRYGDGWKYTLDVEVTAICSPVEFIGRIEGITSDRAEVTGGKTFDELMGQKKKFKNEDIILRRSDLP